VQKSLNCRFFNLESRGDIVGCIVLKHGASIPEDILPKYDRYPDWSPRPDPTSLDNSRNAQEYCTQPLVLPQVSGARLWAHRIQKEKSVLARRKRASALLPLMTYPDEVLLSIETGNPLPRV